jgi:hypothetical protein
MGELLAVLVLADLPGEDAAAPWQQLAEPPGLVEEGELDLAAAVGDDDLLDGAAPLLHGAIGGCPDLGDDRHLLSHDERVDRRQLPAQGVSAGIVHEQVADRAHPERPGERLGSGAEHAVQA